MSSRLVIHIASDEEKLTWFLDGNEASAAASSRQSLIEKSWDNYQGEVIVFVPTADVYLTKAKLPPLSAVKLRKAVPYAIEDEISDDIKNCHFAIASVDSSGNTPIAVVNRERMELWLQLLPEALRQHVSAMVPDVLALPWTPDSWTIVEIGDLALVRLDAASGFAVETSNVVELIAQYMRDNSHKAESITVYSSSSRSDLEKAITTKLQLPVTLKTYQGSWLVFLSNNIDKLQVLNLIQGEYQSNYSTRGIPRLKSIVAAMAVVWLLLIFSFGLIKLGILNYQARSLDAQLAMVYNEIFPGESRELDPKQRIEAALEAVKKARQQSVFLRLVAAVSPVLVNTKGVSVQGATFSNTQLDVQLETTDFQLLDKITADLRAKGVAAEQSRATKVGEVIQSHLVITELR
jgi:general secretion pathway protein L